MAVVVEPVAFAGGVVFVFQEGVLRGGSKQRGAERFLRAIGRPVVTHGASSGFGQVALAVASAATGIPVHFFVHGSLGEPPAMRLAASIAPIHRIYTGAFGGLAAAAEAHAAAIGAEFVPMGVEDPRFVAIMIEELHTALTAWRADYRTHIRRMWLVTGSGTLLRILYALLPDTHFLVVQVGRTIWPEQLARPGAVRASDLFIVGKVKPEQLQRTYPGRVIDMKLGLPFTTSLQSHKLPPYASVDSYDAKVWPCFLAQGAAGDFIFNVAAL